MEKKYFSVMDEELPEQEVTGENGPGNYLVGHYENGALVRKEIFVNRTLEHVVYFLKEGSPDTIVREHTRLHRGVKFSIVLRAPGPGTAKGETLFYDGEGNFPNKQVAYYEREDLYVDEIYDAADRLMGGTRYLKEGGDFTLALEFDSERKYYNAYDFETGDSIPVEEALGRIG